MKRKNFAVFISGYGRGAIEIINNHRNQLIKPELKLILSSNPHAHCLVHASANKIRCAVVERQHHLSKKSFETQILSILHEYEIDYIYLAGWLHILGTTLLNAFAGRIVNVHPSLLPAFKGLNAINQAMDYGVKITGVTTHYVDETLDGGKIIAQKSIEIDRGESFDQIDKRLFSVTADLTKETINQIFI